MKKMIFFFLFLLLSFHVFSQEKKVCFNEQCFLVKVADTQETRRVGLMGQTSLLENEGMFFVFEEEGLHSFWMKNTLLALDMIWIDAQGIIVDIKTDVMPCQKDPCAVYSPQQKAKYVLEIPAGSSKRDDIKIGEKVFISI